MKNVTLNLFLVLLLLMSCTNNQKENTTTVVTESSYLDYSDRDDKLSGGVQMIPVQTKSGAFKVWTKRIGNNPDIKVLLLHGGPGATHEYLECFDSYFPKAGIEYYYYDQLESAYSDQPNDSSLWTVDRYVREVEQVRKSLGLNKDNFYLLGHSWGGILAMEYALKYQDNLKGLIVSNMMASVSAINKYAREVLRPKLPAKVLTELKKMEVRQAYDNPRYNELLSKHYYPVHFLRMPLDEWPEPLNRTVTNLNNNISSAMQGPDEYVVTRDDRLFGWDITNQLSNIKVPTLTIGAKYDTMDPDHMERIATEVQNGRYLYCEEGSHMALYDDQQTFFNGLIRFIEEVDRGKFQ